MSVKKLFPEEKKEYLIESIKQKTHLIFLLEEGLSVKNNIKHFVKKELI